MNALVLEQLGLRPEDAVLEVGFGGGALLADILARTQGPVIGVDISEAMVARARRRFAGQARLQLVVASVEKLPLPAASVDKACSVNNTYFWSDPGAAMCELARVIRPGGTLSICFEPPEELRKWPGHRYGFRLLEEAEVRTLMEQAGFRSVGGREGRGRKPDFFVCLTADRAAAEKGQ